MLKEGVDVKTRMDRLGHVSDKTNLIYSHVGDAAQLAASTAIDRCLEPLGSNWKTSGMPVHRPRRS